MASSLPEPHDPPDPRTAGEALAQSFVREGLESALHLLCRQMSAFGPAETIRCYIHQQAMGLYLGLTEIRRDSEHTTPNSGPMYDSDVPTGLRVFRPERGNAVILLNGDTGGSWGMDDSRYVIRQELFTESDATCYLGIQTNAVALCGPEAGDWLRAATPALSDALRRSLDLTGIFAGNSKDDDPFLRLRVCPGLQNVVRQIERVAPTRATVLIHGETGVGKEYVAESIHRLSAFRGGPFVTVNCGAIPESLVDSLLFGHEKGAFTGAIARAAGYFEQAQGGTLFLDEIGELPMQSQARLLRVLERHTIQRVGGARSVPLHIRIVAATNRDLAERVECDAFREDLLYRLDTYTINIPPLRQRASDILALINHFLPAKTKEYGLKSVPPLLRAESAKLYAHNWPGNVRELENVLDRAFIQILDMPDGTPLRIDIPRRVRRPEPVSASPEADGFVFSGQRSLEAVLNAYITRVMSLTDGKIYGPNGAAQILDIHPNTLRSRLEKMRWMPDAKK